MMFEFQSTSKMVGFRGVFGVKKEPIQNGAKYKGWSYSCPQKHKNSIIWWMVRVGLKIPNSSL